MKGTMTEMMNRCESIKSRLDETGDRINDLEIKVVENTQSEQQNEWGTPPKVGTIRDLWDNIKFNNICTMSVKEEREQGI